MENPITWHVKTPNHSNDNDLTASFDNPQTNANDAKWTIQQALDLFQLPFNDLLFKAQTIHRTYHDPNAVQLSTLLSIKTGGCPEDCAYCPQSARYNTEVEAEKLMPLEQVIRMAKAAKDQGASRFCMGAAWRNPKDHQLEQVKQMVVAVKELGLETCVTLGMLKKHQADELKQVGLDYYNHNLDTSPDFYGDIITTRTYQDRLNTLDYVREAGIKVCCGGIVGLGETLTQRASLLVELANQTPPPESVPINNLVKVSGTPLQNQDDIDPIDFIRTIAVARILMPSSMVRLSAGREAMNESTQALCFLAGANSIFYGDQLLVTSNPDQHSDKTLLQKLGIKAI